MKLDKTSAQFYPKNINIFYDSEALYLSYIFVNTLPPTHSNPDDGHDINNIRHYDTKVFSKFVFLFFSF